MHRLRIGRRTLPQLNHSIRPCEWVCLTRSPRQLGLRWEGTVPGGTWPDFAPSVDQAAPTITLRPYQEDSINAVLSYVAKGERRLGISLATGSGKTVIFSHLIDRLPAPDHDATQTLILAHRRELVEQAAKHCRDLYPSKRIEIDMAERRATGLADVTVASLPSIVSGSRLEKYSPSRFKLLLVDEAHHIVAPGYLKVLEHFGLREKHPKVHTTLVGVSATMSRADGLSLGAAIDHIVYHKDYIDMIENNFLANAVFTTVKTGADLSRVKTSAGDFESTSLGRAVDTDAINALTVRSWLARAEGRKSTLGFCVNVAHAANLTAAFRQSGIDARYITGKTDAKVRAKQLEAFKQGQFQVLLNVAVFTEGTDLPNVDTVLLARPTKSRGLLVQMIGRGLRLHPGKTNCRIIDMVSSLESGIVSTPTLFGLDPQEIVDDLDATALLQLRETKEREAQVSHRNQDTNTMQAALKGDVTIADYDSYDDLLQDVKEDRSIQRMSPFAWVQIKPDHYLLSDKSGDYLSIFQGEHGWSITLTRKLNDSSPPAAAPAALPAALQTSKPLRRKAKAPYMRPSEVATAETFEAAVRAGNTYAQSKFPVWWINKHASWRKKPASDRQLAFINVLRGSARKLTADDLTAGQAQDQITKLKRGAKGRFDGMQAQKRKARKREERVTKDEEVQRRAVVKVGPVE